MSDPSREMNQDGIEDSARVDAERAARRAAFLRQMRIERRIWAGLVLAISLATLSVAAWLRPDSTGYGTHRQLGLRECGALVWSKLPCPTCGMTTAFAHTVRLQWLRAFLAQPSGFALALAAIAAIPVGLFILVRGELPWAHRWPDLTVVRLLVLMLLFFVGGWAFKLVYGLASGEFPVE